MSNSVHINQYNLVCLFAIPKGSVTKRHCKLSFLFTRDSFSTACLDVTKLPIQIDKSSILKKLKWVLKEIRNCIWIIHLMCIDKKWQNDEEK